jgi:hypothetical protein
MPFARVVSKGRGNLTWRMSFETGARFSRSTLLLGIDLSCAASPWLHAHAASAVARMTAAAAWVENRFFVSRLIAYPFVLSRLVLSSLFGAISLSGARGKRPPENGPTIFVILSGAKNLSFFSPAKTEERFFASLRMTKQADCFAVCEVSTDRARVAPSESSKQQCVESCPDTHAPRAECRPG